MTQRQSYLVPAYLAPSTSHNGPMSIHDTATPNVKTGSMNQWKGSNDRQDAIASRFDPGDDPPSELNALRSERKLINVQELRRYFSDLMSVWCANRVSTLTKPFPPKEAVEVAQRALKQNASPAIEVISALPHWVELLIPCNP